MTSVRDWSVTASANTGAATNGFFREHMAYSEVNDAAREFQAILARDRKDKNGTIVAGGTTSSYVLSISTSINGYQDGDYYRFRANVKNVGATTLQVSTLSAKPVVKTNLVALAEGEIVAGGTYEVFYQSASGNFQLLNPSLSQQYVGSGLYPVIADESAVTVVNTAFPYGDFERYGGDKTGVTNSKTAVSHAVIVAASTGYPAQLRGSVMLTTPVLLKNNVTIRGEGASTLVFNDSASVLGSGQCFTIGTYDDGGFTDSSAGYAVINNVTRGDAAVRATTTASAANFTAGDVCYLWSSAGYSTGGYFKPAYQQITEVITANSTSGYVTLRDPVYKTQADMRLSKASQNLGHAGNSATPQLLKNVTIENMRLRSLNDAWSRYGGMYRCTFRDLWIDNGTNVFAMNGAAHCLVENIHATVRVRAIELAYFCHDTQIRNIDVVVHPEASATQDLGIVTFAEGAHDCLVENVNADYRNGAQAAMWVKFGQGSYKNTVRELNGRANTLAFGILATNANPSVMNYGLNVVDDCMFDSVTISGDVIVCTGSADTDPVGLTVRDNIFKTDTISATMIDIDASAVNLIGNDFKDCPADTISVDTTCTEVRMINNIWPTSTALTAFAQANVFAQGNRIRGRDAVETLNLLYGSASTINSTLSTNSLVSQAVPAAGFAAGDEFDVEIVGELTGTDAHTIDVLWDGDVILTFTTTTADQYRISGRLRLNTVSTWKAVTWQSIGTSGDTVRKATTSDTAAISGNGLLEIRAYVGNAASTILVDSAVVKYRPRY